uniref:Retinol dehydrogenase n=1 Tax=Strigamia maritima TaxID=126957 RepID=T1IKE2_STRMM
MVQCVVISFFLVRKWLEGGRCCSTVRLANKTVIVTGSNTGIGKETARDFFRRGARVILACRDLDKAVHAARDIESTAPQFKDRVVVRHLDLADFASIREFAKYILTTEDRIDILVNNAGMVSGQNKTADGFDMVFGTNHLGHFLLTNLLLDKIVDCAPSRIINVASLAHKYGTMHWDDLNLNVKGAYSPYAAYCQSKLANILFTKELARRLKGTGVTVYSLHPGAVKTEIARHSHDVFPAFLHTIFDVLGLILSLLFTKTAEQGAQTTIHCAVSEKVANQTGLYYSDCGVTTPSTFALNEDYAKKLWIMSAEMVKLDEALSEVIGAIKNRNQQS